MNFVQLCEILMLVIFGASWPFNIVKSVQSRTAKGKSLGYEAMVLIGYIFGVTAKFYTFHETGELAYSTWFYLLDIAMVTLDLILSIRNRQLDKRSAEAA